MKRIFVSSTFKDMNYERDAIQELVLPALNNAAREYGESISFCDLRWGVNTADLESEEGSRLVLSVCLDEIDSCRPYMVVLLGERYGWIPSEALIQNAVQNRRGFSLDELEKSVTALEIEYGALKNPKQLEKTLFYFRELEGDAPAEYQKEDPVHQRKLAELKARIIRATHGRVKPYRVRWDSHTNSMTGLDMFSKLVTGDLLQLMEPEWRTQAGLTPYRRDQRFQWDYANQKARQFGAREDLIRQYMARLESSAPAPGLLGGSKNTAHTLAIQGPAGCGKSTLMSRLAVSLQERGHRVVPIFCGSSRLCSDAFDIIRYIVDDIETALSLHHFAARPDANSKSVQDWQDRMAEVISIWTRRQKTTLYILVDGVDQLTADQDRDMLRFIPENLSDRVKLVLSCLDDFKLTKPIPTERVAPLTENNREAVIHGILSSLNRGLDKPVVQAMVSKQGADSPLFLSLLVQRLVMMNRDDFASINAQGGGMDQITAHQVDIVNRCPDDLNGLCVDILEEASRRIGGDMVMTAARYLAVSRHGLRELDLAGIFRLLGKPWSALDFSRFQWYMSSFFFQRDDGRWDFTHKNIRAGFRSQCREPLELHQTLLAHFMALETYDPVRVRELAYHCILANDHQQFVDYATACAGDDRLAWFAAKDAAELAALDGGAWLCALLQSADNRISNYRFFGFFTRYLNQTFFPNQENLKLKLVILQEVCNLSQRTDLKQNTDLSRRNLALCHDTLGTACEALGTAADLENALTTYQASLSLREKLADSQKTALAQSELAQSYERIGKLWVAISDSKGFTIQYRSMVQELKHAQEMYEKSLPIRETLARAVQNRENLKALASCCEELGTLYRERAETDADRMRAMELCKRSLSIRQQLYSQQDSESKRDLALSAIALAEVYVRLGHEYQDQAGKLLLQSLQLLEQISQEQGTAQSARDLSDCYKRVAEYSSSGLDDESRKMTQQMYRKSLAIDEMLVRELGTLSARDALIDTYQQLSLLPDTSIVDRIKFVVKRFQNSKGLFSQTGNARHTNIVVREYLDLKPLLGNNTLPVMILICIVAIVLSVLIMGPISWLLDLWNNFLNGLLGLFIN